MRILTQETRRKEDTRKCRQTDDRHCASEEPRSSDPQLRGNDQYSKTNNCDDQPSEPHVANTPKTRGPVSPRPEFGNHRQTKERSSRKENKISPAIANRREFHQKLES